MKFAELISRVVLGFIIATLVSSIMGHTFLSFLVSITLALSINILLTPTKE